MNRVLTINPKPLASVRRERDDLADQLYQQLKEAIVTGEYRPGDTLPTIKAVAEQLSISTRTVQTAYTALSNEKLIESNRSLGTTVLPPTRQSIIDIAELHLYPIAEKMRRLGLHDNEARALMDTVWKKWFGTRRGERRGGGEIRTMNIAESERRTTGSERRTDRDTD